MTIINLYSMYDKTAQEFGPLVEAKNHAVASRMFLTTQKDLSPEVRNDYSLYFMGQYTKDTGSVLMQPQPEYVTIEIRKASDLTEVDNA